MKKGKVIVLGILALVLVLAGCGSNIYSITLAGSETPDGEFTLVLSAGEWKDLPEKTADQLALLESFVDFSELTYEQDDGATVTPPYALTVTKSDSKKLTVEIELNAADKFNPKLTGTVKPVATTAGAYRQYITWPDSDGIIHVGVTGSAEIEVEAGD